LSIVASQLIGEVSIRGADQGQQQLNEMDQATSKTKSGLSGLQSASNEASSSLIGRFAGAVRGSISGLVDFGKNVGMAVMGYEQLAHTAVSLASSLLQPAASAEMVQTSLTTMLGSTKAAKEEMQALDQFASQTPFETMDIDQAALKMQAVGISTQNVIPDLKSLGDGLAALGKTSGADLDMVVSSFDKIQTSGHLTGDVMMSLSDMGINAWGILEKQTGKTHDELEKMISGGLYPAADAMRDLTQGIEANPLYKGQMATQANTMTGLVSTLKSNWDQMLASFGSPILKRLEPIISNIGSSLASQGFKDFAGGVGQGIVDAFSDIGKAANYVGNILRTVHVQDFAAAWQDVKFAVGQLVGDFGRLGASLHPVSTDFDPLADKIQSLAQGGLNLLTNALNGAYVALSAVDGLFHGGKGPLEDFINTLKPFGPDLQNIANLLGGQFRQAFQFASTEAKQFGDWFRSQVVPALKDALPGFLSLAHTLLENVVPAIIHIRGEAQQFIEHVIQKFGPLIGQTIPPLIRFAGIFAQDLSAGLKIVVPYVEKAADAFFKFADGVMDKVQPIIDKMMPSIIYGVQTVQTLWNVMWPSMQQVLQGVWRTIQGVVQIAWSLVSGIILVGLDILGGNWGQAWTDIQNMLSGVWAGIQNFMGGQMDALKGVLNGVNAFVDHFLVQPFRDAMGTIGGIFGNIGKLISDTTSGNFGALPGDVHALGFASGTSFAPGGLALVGEAGPELMYVPRGAQIFPAGQTQQMLTGGSSGGRPITVVLELNQHQFARATLPVLTDSIRLHTGVRA
jgi:tape measure domain-containing protein